MVRSTALASPRGIKRMHSIQDDSPVLSTAESLTDSNNSDDFVDTQLFTARTCQECVELLEDHEKSQAAELKSTMSLF